MLVRSTYFHIMAAGWPQAAAGSGATQRDREPNQLMIQPAFFALALPSLNQNPARALQTKNKRSLYK